MITKDSTVNDHDWHLNGCARIVGPRGGEHVTCKSVRRNGQTQVWKRSPERFSIPVKYGMYEAFRITESDAARFHMLRDCPLNAIPSPDRVTVSGGRYMVTGIKEATS